MPGILRRLFFFALLGGLVAGVMYLRSEAFSQRWCVFVMEQCERRGIYLTLDRLSLHPLEGLVGKNIQIFQDKAKKILLGEVDQLNLDLDYSKMLKKEFFLEGVDIQQAGGSFLLDPEKEDSERITLKDFSARLFFVGERIEVRKAEGSLFGLHISLTGTLLQSDKHVPKEDEAVIAERRKRQLAAIRARRNLIIESARMLKHFESAKAPTLDITMNGDLSEPEEMSVTMKLSAHGLSHQGYVCEELEASATYAGEMVDLERLHVKDHLGSLEANASWKPGADQVNFHVRSTADLPGLAAALFQNESLREVVFYEPLEVETSGQVLLGKAAPEGAFLPVRCTGMINAGRLASRGKILDGLKLSFGLSPDGCYLRDVLLRHKTGTLGLQMMWQREEGYRYRALLQLDPNVFVPFLRLPQTRGIIQRFEFNDESSIYAEVEGGGPTFNPDLSRHAGRVDLRNFRYRGMDALHATGDVEFLGKKQYFRNIRVQRREGLVTAQEVLWDANVRAVHLDRVVSDADAVAVVSVFAKHVSDIIARYRFDKAPHVETDGVIDLASGKTKLKTKFVSKGTATYPLLGEQYVIHQPVGLLDFEGHQLRFDVAGSVFGKVMNCKGNVSLRKEESDFNVSLRAGAFLYHVFGENMPFEAVRAEVSRKKAQMDFDIKATVFDGAFALKGSLDERVQPNVYQGEMRVNAINFRKFAKVYSPGNDTAGDVTGHLSFVGKMDDWKALKGKGALTILNSNLYAVPILGPLTPLLGAMLPRPIKGYNEAKEADCTFSVADGFATSSNIEALTGVFRLVASGSVDFLENRVQLEAQARFRGLPGLVLFPVSEILEYVGEGSVGNPVWRPKYFSSSNQATSFRKPGELPQEELGKPNEAPAASTKPSTLNRTRRSSPTVKPASPKPVPFLQRFRKPDKPTRVGGK